jgi:hypothetical protein
MKHTALALVLTLGAANLAFAQTTGPAEMGGVARYVLAHDLFASGRAEKDAGAMLIAAAIAGGFDLLAQPVEIRIEGEAAETPDAAAAPPDAAGMAEAARALIDPEETLAVLLSEAELGNRLIRAGALRAASATLAPGQSATLRVPFDGGNRAEAGMVGDGDSALILTVTDEEGAPVCAPRTLGDRAVCAFVPQTTGYFTLRIENPGGGVNSLLILTN